MFKKLILRFFLSLQFFLAIFRKPVFSQIPINCDYFQNSKSAADSGRQTVRSTSFAEYLSGIAKQNLMEYLSCERVDVAGVLADFVLLDSLSNRGSVSGSIFTNDSDLLCSPSCHIILIHSFILKYILKI